MQFARQYITILNFIKFTLSLFFTAWATYSNGPEMCLYKESDSSIRYVRPIPKASVLKRSHDL